MGDEWRNLMDRHPLPRGWTIEETFTHELALGQEQGERGITIGLAGLMAQDCKGHQVVGSAAQSASLPLARAYFELWERVGIIEAKLKEDGSFPLLDHQGRKWGEVSRSVVFPTSPEPNLWQFALSNGVALHTNFAEACKRSWWELAERDRVLRSWYGNIPPRLVMSNVQDQDCIPLLLGNPEQGRWQKLIQDMRSLSSFYQFDLYSFSNAVSLVPPAYTLGLFAFAKVPHVPMAFGLGAGEDFISSLEHALGECLQKIGFFWEEDLSGEQLSFAPTADYHAEFYAGAKNQHIIQQWLQGKREGAFCSSQASGDEFFSMPRVEFPDLAGLYGPDYPKEIIYADLTPPGLEGRLSLVKALSPRSWPLVFGKEHPLAKRVPSLYQFHPIG